MKQSLIKYPNGLKIVLCSKQSNVVTLSFSVLFGAEQEKKDKSGITHFIEKLIKGAIQAEILSLGGIVDSKTDYEHFEVTISTVRENLEQALKILTTTIFDFRPTYQKFREEQVKIIQEVENRKNSPQAILADLTQKNRYKTTSLATELYGTAKTISELDLETIRDYYESILTPEHIVLSVVGNISDEIVTAQDAVEDDEVIRFENSLKDVDLKNMSVWNDIKDDADVSKIKKVKYDVDNLNYIKELVTRKFYAYTIKLKKSSKRRTTAYFPLKKTTIIEKNKNLNQSRFQLSLPSAPYSSSAYRYSKLFEIYLANYLKKSLSGEKGVYGLDVYVSQFKNNAHLNIVFAVDYEKAGEVYKNVIDLLKGQRQESITKSEFRSLIIAYQTMMSLGHEKMSDLAKRFNKWMFLKNELFNLNYELNLISAMNFESFREVAKRIVNFNSMLVVYLGKPLEAGELEV